jgi:hypothetical protein
MPLYFFDEVIGETIIEADEGIEFPDVETARRGDRGISPARARRD